jgi:S-adenosylmethionine:tRNA ribosyltransferase-isomerase
MHYFPNETSSILNQWEAYELAQKPLLTKRESLQEILNFMLQSKSEIFYSETQILIGPGYEFKLIDGMITNFHQPKSTLLLLISAYLGEFWKTIYDYALANDYRFLSYGDSCLFFTQKW